MKLITLLLSLGLLLTVQFSFAGDTTYRKKPVFMSFHAGYTLGRAGGSMPAMLADLNPQFGFRDAYQKTGSGFSLGVMLQKQFTELVYYKTGLSYVKKRVYPEENSYPLYQDSLNTGYLTIPFLFGILQPLNKTRSIWLSVEAGPAGSAPIVDNTYKAPDRAGYKNLPVVLSACAGAGISFGMQNGARLQLHYSYTADITPAINESLYWGAPDEPIRTRSYKYQVHEFSVGVQWPLGKVKP